MNNKFVIEENMPDDLKLALQYMNNHNLDFSTKIDDEDDDEDENSDSFEYSAIDDNTDDYDLTDNDEGEIDDFLGGIG